jgi:hypothetical protein
MVEVIPDGDGSHSGADCPCGPRVEWIGDDDMPYRNGPLVIHNARDLREVFEGLAGAGMPGRPWSVFDRKAD